MAGRISVAVLFTLAALTVVRSGASPAADRAHVTGAIDGRAVGAGAIAAGAEVAAAGSGADTKRACLRVRRKFWLPQDGWIVRSVVSCR